MAKEKKKRFEKSSISCEIEETYGYLNDKKNKIFAKVSWDGKDAKFDIRKCYEKGGELVLSSGISLTEEELEQLIELAQSTERTGVNFQEIFDAAPSIQDNRRKGFHTENGFIKLQRKQQR